MAPEESPAHKLALEAVLNRYADSIELVESDKSNRSFFGLEPRKDWVIFWVHDKRYLQVDGGEYVAVHRDTGEVRHFK